MEFERKEIDIIKNALQERERKLREIATTYEKMTWDNIGNFKEMYADEKAFIEIRQNTLNNISKELEDIDKIFDKIFKEY